MNAEAERISYRSGGPQAKRRIRNYLLVPSFQLKYTSMVVGVNGAIAAAPCSASRPTNLLDRL